MNKTFADIKVGDILYWGAIDMDHVSTTIVTDIHLELDGEHMPKFCEVTLTTNESFKFTICNILLDKHQCIIFSHQLPDNEIYIGTSKNVVATNILKRLDNHIKFWKDRKYRLIKRTFNED